MCDNESCKGAIDAKQNSFAVNPSLDAENKYADK